MATKVFPMKKQNTFYKIRAHLICLKSTNKLIETIYVWQCNKARGLSNLLAPGSCIKDFMQLLMANVLQRFQFQEPGSVDSLQERWSRANATLFGRWSKACWYTVTKTKPTFWVLRTRSWAFFSRIHYTIKNESFKVLYCDWSNSSRSCEVT